MRKILSSNNGAAAVEFALISPLLFVLLFGIIEFSALLYNQAVITNASREGARYAATFYTNPYKPNEVTQPTEVEIQNYVVQYVNAHILSFTDPSPNIQLPKATRVLDAGSPYAGYVTNVEINYAYGFLVFGNLIELLGGEQASISLSATTRMRDENQGT